MSHNVYRLCLIGTMSGCSGYSVLYYAIIPLHLILFTFSIKLMCKMHKIVFLRSVYKCEN